MSKPIGENAFLAYYQKILPANLYQQMLDTIKQPTPPVLRFLPQHQAALQQLWAAAELPWQTLSWYPYALIWPENIPLKRELPGFRERWIYAMNASSLLPVLALDPQPGDVVLDACAAPGGKAMFIADLLNHQGHLIANDLSSFRRHRMQQLFAAYDKTDVEVLGQKAEVLFNDYKDHFDKILIDSPCSSEKHIFNNPNEIKKWEYSRVELLHQRQVNLVNMVSLCLKPGGRLVYSTCAITPEENEAVVAEVLANNRSSHLKLIPMQSNLPGDAGITADYKVAYPPADVRRITADGKLLDPMFVAVFEKTN